MLPIYPSLEQETDTKLAEFLGTFWSDYYAASDVVTRFCSARGQQSLSNITKLVNDIDCLARRTTPTTTRRDQYVIVLRRGDQKPYLTPFGAPGVYYGTSFKFGEQRETDIWAWDLPVDAVDIAAVTNRIASPELGNLANKQVIWSGGTDFRIDLAQKLILFKENPFDNEYFSVTTDLDDSDDDRVIVWLSGVTFKTDYTNEIHDIIGLPTGKTRFHKLAVVSAVDSLVHGPARKYLYEMLEAITGLPLCKSTETVEVVQKTHRGWQVVTDKNVYDCLGAETISVEAGDVLKAGASFTSQLKVCDFRAGTVPSTLTKITIPNSHLLGAFSGDLSFYNTDKDLVVETDEAGYTKVSFDITGSSADVDLFWDTVHENGVDQGSTLAHLLDTRTNKVGEPSAGNLPTTINPAEFAAQNILRNNAVLVEIDEDAILDDALGLDYVALLRHVVAPHTAVIVQSS